MPLCRGVGDCQQRRAGIGADLWLASDRDDPGEKREQRRAAGRATLAYLRDMGIATAAEFKNDVEHEHPVEGQSPDTWWKKTTRKALNRAQEGGLVTFKDGVKEWRWADVDPDETVGPYDPTQEFQ